MSWKASYGSTPGTPGPADPGQVDPGPKEWADDLKETCAQFQVDLSCLVDGELREASVPARRAIEHLEDCSACNGFFEDVRHQVQAHRELADPDSLIERYAVLTGARSRTGDEIDAIDLIHRLSNIFYQLGKAYVLMGSETGVRTRVFEKAVAVEPARAKGRGFVDGVLKSGRGAAGGVDWENARHFLNGRLSEIADPLEKGQRLLQEAVAADPTNEEARLYLAFVDERRGLTLRAAQAYRAVFQTAVEDTNRAHAAVRLGVLYASQKDYRKAIACWRLVTMSGLADEDDRFFFVRFNLGMNYADLGRRERSLASFRALLDRHPGRIAEVRELFLSSPRVQSVIDAQPGFAQALIQTCPELFEGPGSASGPASGTGE